MFSKNIQYPPLCCLIFILTVTAIPSLAQRQDLTSGSLKGLKDQKSYNITFTYDDILIGLEKSEKQFLEEKKKLWEDREAGKGNLFVDKWFADRERYYEPAFIKGFNKWNKVNLTDKNAKYTLALKTKRLEGGWDVGVMSHPGEVGGELWVIESANPNNVVAKIAFFGYLGSVAYPGDFQMTRRIESAYEKAGAMLGNFVKKNVK